MSLQSFCTINLKLSHLNKLYRACLSVCNLQFAPLDKLWSFLLSQCIWCPQLSVWTAVCYPKAFPTSAHARIPVPCTPLQLWQQRQMSQLQYRFPSDKQVPTCLWEWHPDILDSSLHVPAPRAEPEALLMEHKGRKYTYTLDLYHKSDPNCFF